MPEGARWLHEVKYDGYRIIARKSGEEVALFSRSGLDWTVRFPAIAKALSSLPCNSALLDGEIAFVLPSGLTSFKSLQEHIDTAHLPSATSCSICCRSTARIGVASRCSSARSGCKR